MRLRSEVLLPILAVFHASLWVIALTSAPFAWTFRAAFAQYLSTLALVIASGNLVLAARLRPLERGFGGLDKLFSSHRLAGVVVGLVLLAHVTIVPLTTPLLPGRLMGLIAFTLIAGSVVLAIAPRAPWRKLLALRYPTWKAEHRFMGLFVVVAVTHSLLVPTLVRYLPLVRAYVYGFAALGLAAYVYRETVFRVVARRHTYIVAEANPLGDSVLEVHLDSVRAPISHHAGQFAFVAFDGGPTRERHPFTLSAAPADGPLRFSIKASGDFTSALQDHLSAGSSASIEGPYGMFDFRTGRPRQLWIAGGIGITPFLAFLPTVGPDFDVTLVWTVRTAAEAIYQGEIEAAIAEKPNVRVVIWPSAEKGHLTLAALKIERPRELSYYLCGPVVMRDAFLGQLKALGVRRSDIHYEEFSLR